MAKIHPKKPVSQVTGPTFTENDPAKFKGEGKSRGKTAANGVVDHARGPVFTENSTHIPTMNADKPAKESKVIKSGSKPEFADRDATAEDLTASKSGSGGPTDRPYALKSSYPK